MHSSDFVRGDWQLSLPTTKEAECGTCIFGDDPGCFFGGEKPPCNFICSYIYTCTLSQHYAILSQSLCGRTLTSALYRERNGFTDLGKLDGTSSASLQQQDPSCGRRFGIDHDLGRSHDLERSRRLAVAHLEGAEPAYAPHTCV